MQENNYTNLKKEDVEMSDENTLKGLLICPGASPKRITIKNDLETLQKAVGGYIETIYPFVDYICIICNEEGKLLGLPLNRAIRTEEGNVLDIIAGNFLVVGYDECDFVSLSDEQADKYEKLFLHF